MEKKSIKVPYNGRDYDVDVEIERIPGTINFKVKAIVEGEELIFTPHLGGLQITPEDHGLDNGLVSQIAWVVLQGV